MEEFQELLLEPTYWKGPVFVKFQILRGIIIVSICMHLMLKIQIEWTRCLFLHQVLFLFMTNFKE